MRDNFNELMKQKSDIELEEYISNIHAYREEIVRAAIIELENRGHIFTQEELCNFNYEIEQRKRSTGKNTIKVRSNLEKEKVSDETTPVYYSKLAILLITILVNIIFGAILTAMNFSRAKSKTGMTLALICGLVLQIIQFAISFVIPNQLALIIINVVAANVFVYPLWNQFIGKETKYRARSIVIPTIISIVLVAFSLYFHFFIEKI